MSEVMLHCTYILQKREHIWEQTSLTVISFTLCTTFNHIMELSPVEANEIQQHSEKGRHRM
jgi:hypothetical protein